MPDIDLEKIHISDIMILTVALQVQDQILENWSDLFCEIPFLLEQLISSLPLQVQAGHLAE